MAGINKKCCQNVEYFAFLVAFLSEIMWVSSSFWRCTMDAASFWQLSLFLAYE